MDRFVNPYNFIQFPRKKAKAYTDADKHYGVIQFSITTKTPLFIPNSSNDHVFADSKVEGHKSYDFFSYTDLSNQKEGHVPFHEPVIPGSEMRGVVRNVYETLTDSCMGKLNKTNPVKRSQMLFEPGLLKWEGDTLTLFGATSHAIGEDINKVGKAENLSLYSRKNGTKIYYNKAKRFAIIGKYDFHHGQAEGYLLKWGFGPDGGKKKRYHVYELEDEDDVIFYNLTRSQVEKKVDAVIASYLSQPSIKKSDEKAYKDYSADLKNFLSRKSEFEYFPINFKVFDNDDYTLYLSPSLLSKEMSMNSIDKLAGEFAPCESELCPACDLFGKIGENAKASRIRFSDMYVKNKKDENQEYYLFDHFTIENLSSPKLGNTDFYLNRPERSRYWTYDYYTNGDEVICKPGELRGRKFYWHWKKDKLNYKNQDPTNLNKTIRPLKADITFTGELYFDGISSKQLKQLIWIINSGKENLGLKLGMAKPLGYGSVSCKVNAVKERKILLSDNCVNYLNQDFDFSGVTYDSAQLSQKVKKEFYKIAGFDSIPEDVPICYPKNSEEDNGFEWFVNNRFKRLPKGYRDLAIYKTLPNICDADITMTPNNQNTNSKPKNPKQQHNANGNQSYHNQGKSKQGNGNKKHAGRN